MSTIPILPDDRAYRAIARLYPSQTHNTYSAAYNGLRESFWNAQQQEVKPSCIFTPATAEQVQKAIVEVVRYNVPFAIKGGGHSSNVQGSSVHGGFQFDMVNLNHLELSSDKSTIRLGPGLRWSTVYEYLQRHNLMVVGGRDSSVGVSGFIFGGGLSNHGSSHGWGCDHLVSVDIVLADGKLITADANNNNDLFTAVHGGGAHNFGIVTSLTLKTYPYTAGTLWAGSSHQEEKYFQKVLDACDSYTQDISNEGEAHLILDFQRYKGHFANAQWMAHPSNPEAPIFDKFRSLPATFSSLCVAEPAEHAWECHRVTESTGRRNTYWTWTFAYDKELLKSMVELWAHTYIPEHIVTAIEINHITPAHRFRGIQERQKNVFGLDGIHDKMPLIWLLGAVWDDAEDDDLVESTFRSIGEQWVEMAKTKGMYYDYKYMNYAHKSQEVIPSYGKKNQNFLNDVAGKYDPEGISQTLQVGGFKLDGKWAPVKYSKTDSDPKL